MNKKIGLLLVFLVVLFQNAYCWETGNDLIEYWKEYKSDGSNYFSRGMYMGYVSGCLDALEIANYVLGETNYGQGDLGFYIPENATLGQICSVIGKWLENNPEKWNMPAQMLIVFALQESFPQR